MTKKLCSLLSCVLSTAIVLFSVPAGAFELKSLPFDMTGSFDTTLTFGASMRAEGRDPTLLGISNGGTARSVNEDDGNLNFDKDDLISAIAKATHELDLKRGDHGIFVRGTYFYDHASEINGQLGHVGRDRLAKDGDLLDAYLRTKWSIGGKAFQLRAGKQVVSWGESTYLPNGINVINPYDVAKLRTPGSELKEALLPTPMLWASQEITGNISLEGFFTTYFYKTRIDPRGSFFSSNDFVSDDGDKAYLGIGRRNDQHRNLPATPPFYLTLDAFAPRIADRRPEGRRQYGVALRYLIPELNNSELGLYHVTYHSRTPLASGIRGTSSNGLGTVGTARYFAEFPVDISLYGASFNTQGPWGIALQGEYSYRPNQPIQIASPELLLAGLGGANQITGNATAAAAVPAGTEIAGYRRLNMSQAQVTATKAFGPTGKAEQWIVVGEIGMTTFHNISNSLGFNGPGVYLPAPGSDSSTSFGSTQRAGYLTRHSWGYRLASRMDFPNAIGSATVSPRIAFSHDVNGVSPTFNQDTKAATIGANYNLRQVWQVDASYTNYFGGRTFSGTDTSAVPSGQTSTFASSANPLKDRDFYAVSVSFSF